MQRLEDPRFPYKQIEAIEAHIILEACGGEPLTDRDRLDDFYTLLGRPLLKGSAVKAYMPAFAAGVSEVLGADPDKSKRYFLHGALFYAGVLNNLNPIEEFPLEDDVLLRAINTDSVNFTLNAYDRLRDDLPSFIHVLERAREAMGTEGDSKMQQVVMTGAGVLHLLAVESLDRIAEQELESFETAHPELSDLDTMFRELG